MGKYKKSYLSLILLLVPFWATTADKIQVSENGATYLGGESKDNPNVKDLISLKTITKDNSQDMRYQIVKDSAYTLGFRGGMANKSKELINILNSKADRLDLIFNFASLISYDGVLPPVIVEATNIASFSKDQIRTANKVYKILIEEKFVSNPPHWSDYLFTGLTPNFNQNDEYIPEGVKPQNGDEKRLWEENIKIGWKDGEEQAMDIVIANFNRATRDYEGMLRYSELLQTGIVQKGKTAQSVQNLTGNQKEVILGDKLQRLIQKSKFELNVDKWRTSSSPYKYNK